MGGILWIDVSNAPAKRSTLRWFIGAIISGLFVAAIILAALQLIAFQFFGRSVPPVVVALVFGLVPLLLLLLTRHSNDEDLSEFAIPAYGCTFHDVLNTLAKKRSRLGPKFSVAKRWAVFNLLLAVAAFCAAQTDAGRSLIGLPDYGSLPGMTTHAGAAFEGALFAAPFVFNAIRLWRNRSGVIRFTAGIVTRYILPTVFAVLVICGGVSLVFLLFLSALFLLGVDPNSKNVTTILSPVLGTAFFLLMFLSHRKPEQSKILGDRLIHLLFGGAFFERRGVALGQSSVRLVRARDPRAPVLLLRSFEDDDIFVFERSKSVRLEEAVERSVSRYGPFLAVGKPGEVRPAGAARAYYDENTWQPAIASWMDEALFIVFIAGAGQGLQWELRHVLTQGYAHKLIILFPFRSIYTDKKKFVWLRDAFDGTAWEAATIPANLDDVLALHLTSTGRVAALWSDYRSVLSAAANIKRDPRSEEIPDELNDALSRAGTQLAAALEIAIYGLLQSRDRSRGA